MWKLTAFIAYAFAAVAVPSPQPAKAPIKIPFIAEDWTSGKVANHEAILREINATLAKYRATSRLDLRSFGVEENLHKRVGPATGKLHLFDLVEDGTYDTPYYGRVTLAGQTFRTIFDTGSADFLIPGPACDNCRQTHRYQNSGQDQHETFTVSYGNGQLSGEAYKDAISIAGYSVPAQGFISMTDASGFPTSGASSIMGMGFSTISESGYPTFFENLMAQGSVQEKRFAFYLGRRLSQTRPWSELTLGGIDTTRFSGNLSTFPVTTKGYWQIALDDVTLNGTSVGSVAQGQAAIDTSLTMIYAPSAAASAIFSKIPGAIPLPGQSDNPDVVTYAFPCSDNSSIAITFGGTQFNINQLDLNLGPIADGASYCLSSIAGADTDSSQNLYLIGAPFLRNWYSVYDYDGGATVSFAAAKRNNVGG